MEASQGKVLYASFSYLYKGNSKFAFVDDFDDDSLAAKGSKNPDTLNPEKSIPAAVLKGVSVLAILTVAKVRVLLAYKLGTGLVVARRSDGSWSAPSAILSAGLGCGAQVGGELMDFIIVLHDAKAVRTFRLVLTLPIITATTERVFSAMKRVKSVLRNRIKSQYLSNSIVVYIEQELFSSIDSNSVINEFYGKSGRCERYI